MHKISVCVAFVMLCNGDPMEQLLRQTSSVLVAQVGEAPHVSQSYDGPSNRQHKLHFVAPLASLLHFVLLNCRTGHILLGYAGKTCSYSVSCKITKGAIKTLFKVVFVPKISFDDHGA